MHNGKGNEEGFTGLEAAIVLIAFIVVAAVFSYVVLGAGFYTTQKAQETCTEVLNNQLQTCSWWAMCTGYPQTLQKELIRSDSR